VIALGQRRWCNKYSRVSPAANAGILTPLSTIWRAESEFIISWDG
jgi:hypothetical protein